MLIEFAKEKSKDVDACLDELLPQPAGEVKILYEAMRYSVFAGGKRLRPCLFLAVMELFGRNSQPFLPFASALEMIHTYSLIHDDLPAMDDDDFRRGKPTCHKVFGEAQAILAGDALLTYAFNAMIKVRPYTGADALLDAIDEVAWSAGIDGMVAGQVADMEWENRRLDIGELEYIHQNKTGALFKASILSAAILAGADAKQLAALREYAIQIGLVFQIADDILDVVGDEKKLGKPVGSDAKNEKSTYPALLGLDEARRLGEKAAESARCALMPFGDKAAILMEVPEYFLNREN